MNTLSYKTLSINKSTADKQWVVIDAEGEVLGRLASKVAKLIRGKYKPNFTPHADCGDNVIVVNAEKIELTGNKWEDKVYVRYTNYPGGQRFITAEEMKKKKGFRIIEKAVKGMLPKNKLGRAIYKNLHVFEGSDHTHEAQKPIKINLNDLS